MSLDEEMRPDEFDPDVERLEDLLQSSTPSVTPPSIGVLQRIRERRRRRKQVASGLGAIALLAGSASLGLLAIQASDSIGGTGVAITTIPGGIAITEADVERWLTDLPDSADSSGVYLTASVPQPEVVREFIGCAWVTQWRDALDTGDRATADESLVALESSVRWVVSAQLPPESETFSQLAVASRFAANAAEAENSALWQRCSQ